MDAVTAQRTLVKSPPELWSEVSDTASLARHLGAFGEIRITRTEEESTVAWEGERASGTVELHPSGWGTKVTLTARTTAPVEAPECAGAEATAPADAAPADPVAPPDLAPPGPVAPPDPAQADPAPPGPPMTVDPVREPAFRRLLARLGLARRPHEADPPEPAAELTTAPAPQDDATAPDAPADDATAPVASADDAMTPDAPADDATAAPTPQDDATLTILTDVLDTLGSAHHRPFSRG